jgi:hypothetical protein
MRTVVAGLIALAVSASLLVDDLTDVVVPSRVLALGVLIGAGVLLLGNGIATAVREQRLRAEEQDPYRSSVPDDQPTNRS